MNLLAHLYLADYSHSSYAGQILGDIVKGRLSARYAGPIGDGIQLHRTIDRVSDAHPGHTRLRNRFDPPLRRYAGILVDIGLDFSLARAWPRYSNQSLSAFAHQAEARVRAEWPIAAPFGAHRMRGLARILAGYQEADGLQRALDSVAHRLRRDNPVDRALPAILAERDAFDAELPTLLAALQRLVSADPA